MRILLLIVAGSQKGESYSIDKFGKYLIGRAAEADFVIQQDTFVSRRHCIVEFSSNCITVEDSESRGGTYLNGNKVQNSSLDHGDIIQIGQTKIKVSINIAEEDADQPQDKFSPDNPLRIPGFTLIKELPSQGAGVSWWAIANQTNRIVTLHFLESSEANIDEEQKRFLRRATICSRINHPAIINFLDQGIAGNYFWFATEVIDGQNLRQYVARYGSLPVDKAVDLILQAIEIIDHLHERDIVHRSLRPESFFVKRHGGDINLKLIDLGSAKCFSELRPITQMNTPGYPIHAYTAPEALTDFHAFNPRSDIYSIGAILNFLVSSKDLFETSSQEALLISILNLNPDEILSSEQPIPDSIQQIILKTISSNINNRPESAEELKVLLKQAEIYSSPLSDLRDQINQSFNEDELRSLCFDLGIDYEELLPGTKKSRVQELLLFCERHNRIKELIEQCHRLRPHQLWDFS